MSSIVRGLVAGMRMSAGRRRTLRKTISGYAKWGVRWKNASSRCMGESWERQHAREELARRLHGALRPAELLRAKGADVLGELGRRHDVLAVDEAPARELRAVAEVQVLGERVVLPAAAPAMAALRQMPPVPLKLKSQPAAVRARFSTR